MNVFYEDQGAFKTGTVLTDNITSLHIESPHGKRTKIKSTAVLLQFANPSAGEFMDKVQAQAREIDSNFLWECCGENEFSFEALAKDYFGHEPSALESASILMCLHNTPTHFYKKGKGKYKAAPEEALKAALASIERKKVQALQQEQFVAKLTTFELPNEFQPIINKLLYAPDRNSLEYKALDAACTSLKTSAVKLLSKCGAVASPYDYHLQRFLFEHFPQGVNFGNASPCVMPDQLPLAQAQAFSIDDVTTTEIDDAFSVTELDYGRWQIGVHIAVPALAFECGSPLDEIARKRLSTVYMPGDKITMLPEHVINQFTLAEQRECPALSMYIEIDSNYDIQAIHTRVERVPIVANLRHDILEQEFNEHTVAGAQISNHSFAPELQRLFHFASRLEQLRPGATAGKSLNPEYSFYVENNRVRITERRRGSPIDKVVSELMIFVNTEWGKQLAEHSIAGIYRVQMGGKVKMSAAPAPHQGLGVAQYLWASSPLRRYVDLVNQRQLLALINQTPAPYNETSEPLFTAMHDFELAHEAYAEFQRNMERYWCLRWLEQENVKQINATVLKETMVKLEGLPLYVRVPSITNLAPGSIVMLEIADIDLLELTVECHFIQKLEVAAIEGV